LRVQFTTEDADSSRNSSWGIGHGDSVRCIAENGPACLHLRQSAVMGGDPILTEKFFQISIDPFFGFEYFASIVLKTKEFDKAS